MSFVGARPARTLVASKHEKKIPFFAITYSMPPGISGWAQIHQGTDSGYDTILERVKYNLYYVKHYSIFFDLYIFLKSIKLFFSLKKPAPTQSEVQEKKDSNDLNLP
jgi:lipopolysaccharide/colanic/teichoic acid biosynthesis glycosyltransferase